MRVTFAGHSTVLIEQNGARVLTDPILHRRIGHLTRHPAPVAPVTYRDLTVVLISHGHLDHLHKRSLRLLDRATPVVTPTGLGRTVAQAGFSTVHELAAGKSVTIGAARVSAVHAEHDVKRHPLADASPALGYVIDAGSESGARAYFAGDTDLFAGMKELATGPLAPVDVALMPVWGWGPSLGPGHMDPRAAARAIELVEPRIAIPIHWGTLLPAGLAKLRRELLVDPPHAFERFVGQTGSGCEVRILLPGQSTEVAPARDDR